MFNDDFKGVMAQDGTKSTKKVGRKIETNYYVNLNGQLWVVKCTNVQQNSLIVCMQGSPRAQANVFLVIMK